MLTMAVFDLFFRFMSRASSNSPWGPSHHFFFFFCRRNHKIFEQRACAKEKWQDSSIYVTLLAGVTKRRGSFRGGGEAAAKNGCSGWRNLHTLCFVACLVTSNNRLALKSPGRGLERDFFFFWVTPSQIFRFDAQLSVAVVSGCEPMQHLGLWSTQKRSETLAS